MKKFMCLFLISCSEPEIKKEIQIDADYLGKQNIACAAWCRKQGASFGLIINFTEMFCQCFEEDK